MILSFFKRFFSSRSSSLPHESNEENPSLKIFVIQEGGKYFKNFKLFHYQTDTTIDTLLFLPHYGIFFGETLSWKASELEHATVERSSIQKKQSAATHFESTESKIRSKLQDVLSFDFTPVYRFIKMEHLSESEFDLLDSSFHELLPKNLVIFSDESVESIKQKLYAMGDYLSLPLSSVQIIGALQTHTFLLPTATCPSGALLSPQQHQFLTIPLTASTTLYGNYGTGKSTLMIRKIMLELLNNPDERIIVFAPTIVASDLLRDAFVSLMYYGVISVDLHRIVFASSSEDLGTFKPFLEATTFVCDDFYAMPPHFIEALKRKGATKKRLIVTLYEDDESDTNYELTFSYRSLASPLRIESDKRTLLSTLLSELRKYIVNKGHKILIITPYYDFAPFKDEIDEYLGLNSRILTPNFTLQTQDLDDLIIATEETLSGISASHLIILSADTSKDYTYALSRASETATIITCLNTQTEDINEENTQK